MKGAERWVRSRWSASNCAENGDVGVAGGSGEFGGVDFGCSVSVILVASFLGCFF